MLRPEIIPRILIGSRCPEFGGFAALYVLDVDEILIEGFGAPLTGLMQKHDHVIVRGGDVMDLRPEGACGEFHEFVKKLTTPSWPS